MTPRPMRILLLTTSLLHGGAETQVFLLARSFRERGHAVHVVSMLPPQAYGEELAELDVPLTSLDLTRGRADVRGVTGLAKTIRRWRPDVVHAHMVHAILLARVTRPLAWTPVLISTMHNQLERSRRRTLAYAITDRLGTLTTNVCKAGADRFVAAGATPRSRMRTMPNGIEVDRYVPKPGTRDLVRAQMGWGDAFVWIAVGRLVEEKDYPNLLRAFRSVRTHHPSAILVIVGTGDLQANLEADRASLGLGDDAVRFLGTRDDVANLLAGADGYVMSSQTEGLPLVLLEAASAGLPIVATDVGGNGEIVLDGRTGLLVEPEDPEALSNAMRQSMVAPLEVRSAWQSAALAHVRANFAIGPVADRWLDLFAELLHHDRRP